MWMLAHMLLGESSVLHPPYPKLRCSGFFLTCGCFCLAVSVTSWLNFSTYIMVYMQEYRTYQMLLVIVFQPCVVNHDVSIFPYRCPWNCNTNFQVASNFLGMLINVTTLTPVYSWAMLCDHFDFVGYSYPKAIMRSTVMHLYKHMKTSTAQKYIGTFRLSSFTHSHTFTTVTQD